MISEIIFRAEGIFRIKRGKEIKLIKESSRSTRHIIRKSNIHPKGFTKKKMEKKISKK